MDQWFEHLTEQISLASDETAATKVLEKLTTEAGFSTFIYLRLGSSTLTAISNYADEWQRRYFESYIEIDPSVRGLRQRDGPFAWAEPTGRVSKEIRQFFTEAAEFGIRSGITIPITAGFGQTAMLTLASGEAKYAETRQFNAIRAVAAVGQLHSRLDVMRIVPRLKIPVRLKAEETTCLRWSAEGKSMKAIATIENISYATVCFHLANAKQSLGAISLSQATAIATALHLI